MRGGIETKYDHTQSSSTFLMPLPFIGTNAWVCVKIVLLHPDACIQVGYQHEKKPWGGKKKDVLLPTSNCWILFKMYLFLSFRFVS